jgi:hypothetical protein
VCTTVLRMLQLRHACPHARPALLAWQLLTPSDATFGTVSDGPDVNEHRKSPTITALGETRGGPPSFPPTSWIACDGPSMEPTTMAARERKAGPQPLPSDGAPSSWPANLTVPGPTRSVRGHHRILGDSHCGCCPQSRRLRQHHHRYSWNSTIRNRTKYRRPGRWA